jgi:PIN domain nuclease of toxin-antitoxin system
VVAGGRPWDPFDRILVAQARCAGLTLVTSDENIARYDVAQVHAGA